MPENELVLACKSFLIFLGTDLGGSPLFSMVDSSYDLSSYSLNWTFLLDLGADLLLDLDLDLDGEDIVFSFC